MGTKMSSEFSDRCLGLVSRLQATGTLEVRVPPSILRQPLLSLSLFAFLHFVDLICTLWRDPMRYQ